MRLYIEKISPFMIEGYDKNIYLDRCIEDLYKECEAVRVRQFETIKKVKSNVAALEEKAEMDEINEAGVLSNDEHDESRRNKSSKKKKDKFGKIDEE